MLCNHVDREKRRTEGRVQDVLNEDISFPGGGRIAARLDSGFGDCSADTGASGTVTVLSSDKRINELCKEFFRSSAHSLM